MHAVAGGAVRHGLVAQAGGEAVVALLVPAHLVHRQPVPRRQFLGGVAGGARLPGDGAEGDLGVRIGGLADVVLPVAVGAVGRVGDPAGQRRPVHALPVDGEDAVVALPAGRGEIPLVDRGRGVGALQHVVGAVAVRARGGLVQPLRHDRLVVDPPVVHPGGPRDAHVPLRGDLGVRVAPGAGGGEVAVVDRRGGEGPFRHRVGAVAIRARRAVDDGLAVGGDHVPALRVDGGHLGVATGAVHPLHPGGVRQVLDIRVAVGAGDVRVHGGLVRRGVDVERHAGELPEGALGALHPSRRHVGRLFRRGPAEDRRVAVAVEALPVVQRGGGAGEKRKDRQGEDRREEGPDRTPARISPSHPPLVRCSGSQSRGESPCFIVDCIHTASIPMESRRKMRRSSGRWTPFPDGRAGRAHGGDAPVRASRCLGYPPLQEKQGAPHSRTKCAPWGTLAVGERTGTVAPAESVRRRTAPESRQRNTLFYYRITVRRTGG